MLYLGTYIMFNITYTYIFRIKKLYLNFCNLNNKIIICTSYTNLRKQKIKFLKIKLKFRKRITMCTWKLAH